MIMDTSEIARMISRKATKKIETSKGEEAAATIEKWERYMQKAIRDLVEFAFEETTHDEFCTIANEKPYGGRK